MLRWAIDRYQREKQAPLLQRATSLFAALTSGSFVRVRAEFDDKDHATLEGVRANESAVGVAGMSEGTVDQLFLALRLAAIYEYIEHSPPMPVIADDLLINFDDERAEAALRVLAELARHTQVIFFTHHQHLVDIARSTLGADAHITSWDRANGLSIPVALSMHPLGARKRPVDVGVRLSATGRLQPYATCKTGVATRAGRHRLAGERLSDRPFVYPGYP
jgi:hypothetical protein